MTTLFLDLKDMPMEQETTGENSFLSELYAATNGDTQSQASMYDIGDRLGLEKDLAGEIAQTLCIKGFAELKTLSGGIGITVQGMKELNMAPGPADGLAALTLGNGPVLDDDALSTVNHMTDEIKKTFDTAGRPYPKMEEIIIDMKTIEVQLLSPRPKTDIIREIFRSIHLALKDGENNELTARLDALISS